MQKALSLDGRWQYQLDPQATGEAETMLAAADGWPTMELPANWQLGGVEDYAGVVWYRRSFDITQKGSSEWWLQFRGVDYFAQAWLNGIYLGAHEGYFQPFRFLVTDVLREGANVLLVRVDSPREEPGTVWPGHKRLIKGIFNHHDCRPGQNFPQWGQSQNTGGIWHSVELLTGPAIYIAQVKVTPTLAGKVAALAIELTIGHLDRQAEEGQIDISISPVGAAQEAIAVSRPVRLYPGSQKVVCAVTVPEPRLWWTWDQGEQPLYRLAARLQTAVGTDTAQTRFGIREVRIDGDFRWWLNGRSFFPRGTNVIPTQWLSEYDAAMIAQDIALLKGANVNAVRVHAHVNRQEFYAACDEAGLLVWQDFALQWGYEQSDAFAQNALRQIAEMVDLLYNHPSIAVWCGHNEPMGAVALDNMLAQAARAADASRPVFAATDFSQHTYFGWYVDDYRQYAQAPYGPFVNEFGAQALPDVATLRRMFSEAELNPQTEADWLKWAFHDFQYVQTFQIAKVERGNSIEEFVANSQAYQAELLKFAIESYRRAKYRPMTGLFQFMFADCWPAITWSVVDYYRRPKLGYEALRLAYQPVLPIVVLRNPRLAAGDLSFLDSVWVVNDRHQAYPGAWVSLALKHADGELAFQYPLQADIAPDCAQRVFWAGDVATAGVEATLGDIDLGALLNLPAGDYVVEATVYTAEGEELGHNSAKLTFVPAVAAAPLAI